MSKCIGCGAEIIPLDESFSRKLMGRGTTDLMCLSCLEKEYGMDDETMELYAERWIADGCALFRFSDPEYVSNFFKSRRNL